MTPVEKLDNGDSLTDEELDDLIFDLDLIYRGLCMLNYPQYRLTEDDVYRKLRKCCDYRDARRYAKSNG